MQALNAVVGFAMGCVLVMAGRPYAAGPDVAQAPSNADAPVLVDFTKRIGVVMDLHRKVEAEIPKVSDNSSIEQIDRYERAFRSGLAAARAGAKRGDVFTPPVERLIRRILTQAFSGTAGRQLRESVMDENPVGVPMMINGPYPETVPLTTMPPDLLAALPPLPDGLEYRFIGLALAILDVPAQLIVDFIPDALPR